MPNWLVSRAMSNAAKANGSENAQCGRDKKNVKKEHEDAENGNVKKENTKKDYEDVGNGNVGNGNVPERTPSFPLRGTPPCLWRPWRWYSG